MPTHDDGQKTAPGAPQAPLPGAPGVPHQSQKEQLMSDELERMIPGYIYAGKDGEIDYVGSYYQSYKEALHMCDPGERVYALVDTTVIPLEDGQDIRSSVAGAFARQYDVMSRNERAGFDVVAFEADVEAALVAVRAMRRAAEDAGVPLQASVSVQVSERAEPSVEE